MEHAISGRLANPNHARGQCPHNCRSSYEYPIHSQLEDSPHYEMITYGIHLCWQLCLEWLINFEHLVRSLLKTCMFGVCS